MALTMAATATFFSSCQKEKITPTTDFSQLSDADLAKKIGDFRTQVLDAQKNGNTQTISFGDAIYLMEAVFNYYHGFTSEEYSATVTETITLPVNYNINDEIAFTELNSIFVELNNTMVEKFEALKMDNKRTMMFDVELTEEGLQVLMTAGSVETNKVSQECINNAPFGATDYWLPGDVLDPIMNPNYYATGKCGQFTGQCVGHSDARGEQEKAARKYRRGNFSAGLHYFTDLTPYSIYDEIGLFSGYSFVCISPEEMNTHYQTIGNKIDYYYGYYNVPQTKQFANIRIVNDFMLGIGKTYYFQTFVHTITYGIKRERTEIPSLPSFL